MWTSSVLPELDRKTTELPSDSAGETPACWTPSFRACSRKSSGIRRARRASSLPPNSRISTDCDPPSPEDRRPCKTARSRALTDSGTTASTTGGQRLPADALRRVTPQAVHAPRRACAMREKRARGRVRRTPARIIELRGRMAWSTIVRRRTSWNPLHSWTALAGVDRQRRFLATTRAAHPQQRAALPSDPPTVEEIIAVMRAAGDDPMGSGFAARSSCCGAPGCGSAKRSRWPRAIWIGSRARFRSDTERAAGAVRSGWTVGHGSSSIPGSTSVRACRSARCSACCAARQADGRAQRPGSVCSCATAAQRRGHSTGCVAGWRRIIMPTRSLCRGVREVAAQEGSGPETVGIFRGPRGTSGACRGAGSGRVWRRGVWRGRSPVACGSCRRGDRCWSSRSVRGRARGRSR